MKFSLFAVVLLLSSSSFAQNTAPTAAAPLQAVNNQILQINNNLQTQQPTPLPTPTLTPLPPSTTNPVAPSLTK